MNEIKLARVDFRLIHGQVMTRWVKKYNINHIIVIDDQTATSPILKKIILNAAPTSILTEVLTSDQALIRWKNNEMTEKNLLILFKSINTAVDAWKKGINFEKLQIGGVEGAGHKKAIFRNVVMSDEEISLLKEIDKEDVDIYIQPIPEDTPMSFSVIKNKF